jgi:hypothetical protein
MKIRDLYKALLQFYDLDSDLDIESFVYLNDPLDVDHIGSKLRNMEELLVRQVGDDLEIGLYLAPEVLLALEREHALERLDEFSCAAEGVSHFLYLTDRAQRGRTVSKLELELQAEVDKFLLIHLIESSARGSAGPELFDRQFVQHDFDAGLGEAERHRYETASHYAAKHCFCLKDRYFNPLRFSALAFTSRDFFHRDLSGKLSLLTP